MGRYRASGHLSGHEQPTGQHPRKHRLGSPADLDATLLDLLREKKAILTFRVGYKFWRSISLDPRNVSRGAPGHWYYPNKNKEKLYTDEKGDTIIEATARETIRLIRVRRIFSCSQKTAYHSRQTMPDGTMSIHRIAVPKPLPAFRRFENHPFIRKAKEMMMQADDNLMSDHFRLHRGAYLPMLKDFRVSWPVPLV